MSKSKRRRPSRHYRRVRTKKGRRKVLINPKIKKKTKSKTKIRGTISKVDRRVFNYISNPSYFRKEFGGGIDFDEEGNLENINVAPGSLFEIELPPDFETQYHTHPDKKISPPTPEDILALLSNKNQQAELIFRDGKVFQIIKTPSSRALSKLPATQLFGVLDEAFHSSMGKNWEQDWKKELEKLGFIVYINNNPNSKLLVKIKPIEPKKKKRKLRKWA